MSGFDTVFPDGRQLRQTDLEALDRESLLAVRDTALELFSDDSAGEHAEYLETLAGAADEVFLRRYAHSDENDFGRRAARRAYLERLCCTQPGGDLDASRARDLSGPDLAYMAEFSGRLLRARSAWVQWLGRVAERLEPGQVAGDAWTQEELEELAQEVGYNAEARGLIQRWQQGGQEEL